MCYIVMSYIVEIHTLFYGLTKYQYTCKPMLKNFKGLKSHFTTILNVYSQKLVHFLHYHVSLLFCTTMLLVVVTISFKVLLTVLYFCVWFGNGAPKLQSFKTFVEELKIKVYFWLWCQCIIASHDPDDPLIH